MITSSPASRFRLALALCALGTSSLSAATTIAYWNDFSGATVQDNTANNIDLFKNPMSLADSDWYATGTTTTGDNPLFTANALTLETIFKPTFINTGTSGSSFITGQFRSDQVSERAYALLINSSDRTLRLSLSSDGSNSTILNSGFQLTAGNTYYVAASFDLTGATASERTATIYFQNLSDTSATLLQATFSGIGYTSIKSSSSPFALGAMGSGASQQYLTATFSEARLTSGVLAASELLVAASIPEPSSAALLLGGLTLGFASLRRRRK